MISTYQEAYILLVTIYGGILIGFIYDLYKIFRGIFNPKKIATLIQDFLFWLIISIVAFYVLIISNQGALRFYNFLGFLIGAIIYSFLLSDIVIRAVIFILRTMKKFIVDLYHIITYPLRVGLCLIAVPCSYCKTKTKPIYYKTKRYVKLPSRMLEETKKSLTNYFKKK
ncbi:spore cortex biosynthesis protein YabQ [Natronincola ferrireducens]|uniref:Spore cortex biosynthesis protein YabQ n=1 Tax=Natronincola ferrireducens TaxID=393762 RepID=A0A1G8WZD7_9FIRM|nr:spore cortex biosynthesis protein YabQ [Natronincola ferrireducens]SDJ83758.1 spore cortex biosynthesis protein YabQ [Natronincola ferrireducens]